MDGNPVRILEYKIPKDPTKDRWVPEVIDEGLHVVHNFAPVPRDARGNDITDLRSAAGQSVHQHGDGVQGEGIANRVVAP